jgi:hypothetical protein
VFVVSSMGGGLPSVLLRPSGISWPHEVDAQRGAALRLRGVLVALGGCEPRNKSEARRACAISGGKGAGGGGKRRVQQKRAEASSTAVLESRD